MRLNSHTSLVIAKVAVMCDEECVPKHVVSYSYALSCQLSTADEHLHVLRVLVETGVFSVFHHLATAALALAARQFLIKSRRWN